jgi:hypothetical protein
MIFIILGEIKKRTVPALRRMVQKLKTVEVFFDSYIQPNVFKNLFRHFQTHHPVLVADEEFPLRECNGRPVLC